MKRSPLFLILALLAMPGSESALAAPPKASGVPAPLKPGATAPTEESGLSGKVVETMNAGGYTYVRLEKGGKKTWVAVPEMKVSVGQKVALQPGQAMENFTSKTLGRTFDVIIFSGGPLSAQSGAHGSAGTAKAPVSKAAASSPGKNVKVDKAKGTDAYTVGEIYEKGAALNKKTAVVRAQVVKVSAGIMGKNWIHLQDGTGDSGEGTHNLVATSQDLPAVGDVVTMKGTVYKDKDFGSGYKYSVIMEEAGIQR